MAAAKLWCLDMSSHPTSGTKGAAAGPLPALIIDTREAAGLTQVQAAELIHATRRGWQEYEAGNRRMHPGLFELFCLKVAVTA